MAEALSKPADADEIAEMANRGQDLSPYFPNHRGEAGGSASQRTFHRADAEGPRPRLASVVLFLAPPNCVVNHFG